MNDVLVTTIRSMMERMDILSERIDNLYETVLKMLKEGK